MQLFSWMRSRRPINWLNVTWLSLAASAGIWISYKAGFVPIHFIVDKEIGSVWPAWLQAIGSLLGLGIAIAVPNIIHNSENEAAKAEKRIREKSFVLAALPPIQRLLSNMQQARWSSEPGDAPDELADYRTASDKLNFPYDLKRLQLHLFETGPAAEDLYRALAMIPQVQQALNYADVYQSMDGMHWDHNAMDYVPMEEPDDVFPLIDAAIGQLNNAISKMNIAIA